MVALACHLRLRHTQSLFLPTLGKFGFCFYILAWLCEVDCARIYRYAIGLISELEATKVNHRLGIRWLVRVVGFRIYDRIAFSGSSRNFSA